MWCLYYLLTNIKRMLKLYNTVVIFILLFCWLTILPRVITTYGIEFNLFAMMSLIMNYDKLYKFWLMDSFKYSILITTVYLSYNFIVNIMYSVLYRFMFVFNCSAMYLLSWWVFHLLDLSIYIYVTVIRHDQFYCAKFYPQVVI